MRLGINAWEMGGLTARGAILDARIWGVEGLKPLLDRVIEHCCIILVYTVN